MHEVVLAALNREIADLRHRHAALERDPVAAAVDRREDAELRPGKQQVGVHMILSDSPDVVTVRQIAGDGRPRRTAVEALQRGTVCSRRAASC